MHFILFNTILEKHTAESLIRAMEKRGHQVTWTGRIWRGYQLPTESKDLTSIQQHVDKACALRPDAILNFSAATLTPRMIQQLRNSGIFTMVWLPDDPVLYDACYKHVVDYYDLMLHCGNEKILTFYQTRHGKSGVNFPFWTDEYAIPFSFDPEHAQTDLVFLGNCVGPVRKNRYDFIATLPFQTRILGNVSQDPFGISAGYYEETKTVAKELGKSLCGLSIPQYFKDYKDSVYNFAGLEKMGHFQFPSRVIQYAAAGLPIFSMEPDRSSDPLFPELIRTPDRRSLITQAESLLSDKQRLSELSLRTYERFRHSFSAISRTILLEQLVSCPKKTKRMSLVEKARAFAYIPREQKNSRNISSTTGLDVAKLPHTYFSKAVHLQNTELPSINKLREELRTKQIESPKKWRILHIGTFVNGETDIVASLYRSLRILGHTVVHLDFRKHRHIISNFPQIIDGRGPVYVRYDEIKPWIDRLNPQIIICNAGGLCFTQSDADTLKDRGILLVGITLSDPDVQPTVISYADSFDYHTTNSLKALKQYQHAGIHNTLLLPFGIDRSFILTDCENDKALQADVICLGHAVDRPERQSLMQQLAQQFHVRVYGRGWDLPNAMVVNGLQLLQASRGGRVHINFPKTLAGCTNVKCGVFESIGSGAILCTEEFKEMGRYFDYGTEIVGFTNHIDLADKLHELFESPSLLESIRCQGFKRLINEHLYEHRWLDLFNKIHNDIFKQTEIVSSKRAKTLRATLKHSYERPRKVVINGWYGQPNTGDELILRAITEGINRNNINIEFTVAAENPVNVEQLHGIPAISRTNIPTAATEIAESCAVILGGGGLWHDYTFKKSGGAKTLFSHNSNALTSFAKIPLLARMHGKPFDVFGIGVGPLSDLKAKKFLRFVADNSRSISVRDTESYNLLTGIPNWKKPVTCYPDPVYSLELNKNTDVSFSEIDTIKDYPYILVNLRAWHANKQYSIMEKVARVLENFATINQCAIVGIPFQAGTQDHDVLQRTFKMIDNRIPRVLLNWSGEFYKVFHVIRNARIVLAMRLHTCLLAHRLDTPTIGIAYDPKVSQHFTEVNNDRYVVNLDFLTKDLLSLVQLAWEQNGCLSQETRDKIVEVEQKSKKGIFDLAQRISNTKTDYSLPVIQFENEKQVLPSAPNTDTEQALPSAPITDTDFHDSTLNLAEAKVSSGSIKQPDADIPFVIQRKLEGIRYYIDKSAPQEGEYVEMRMQLHHLANTGQLLKIKIKSPYCRPKNQGRICYQIHLDDQLLLEEDVAYWNEINHVQILWRPTRRISVLHIHSQAKKDCEPWTWGYAGRLIIKEIALHPCEHNDEISVMSTSPFSKIINS